MRKEKISEVLGYMDEKLVEEAGNFTGIEKVKSRKNRSGMEMIALENKKEQMQLLKQ